MTLPVFFHKWVPSYLACESQWSVAYTFRLWHIIQILSRLKPCSQKRAIERKTPVTSSTSTHNRFVFLTNSLWKTTAATTVSFTFEVVTCHTWNCRHLRHELFFGYEFYYSTKQKRWFTVCTEACNFTNQNNTSELNFAVTYLPMIKVILLIQLY